MHPFFDEKEYFAGAYENSLFVIKVSKNSLNTNEAVINNIIIYLIKLLIILIKYLI